MIISHKHRFIFIKTAKTAGSSIEIALSRLCGDDDIITPISKPDEDLRRDLGIRGAQNFAAPMADYGIRDWARYLAKGKRKLRFYNHMPACEAKALIPADLWQGYFKFCFERNPWDRVVSHYFHLYQSGEKPTIREYLERGYASVLRQRGFLSYTIDGELAVDHVGRFEAIPDELRRFLERIGVSDDLDLPRAKSSFRNDKRHYRELLTREEAQIVGEMFKDEVELMGYAY